VEKAQIKLYGLKREIRNTAQVLSQSEALLCVSAELYHLFCSGKCFHIFSVSALTCLTSHCCFRCCTSNSNTTNHTSTMWLYLSWPL